MLPIQILPKQENKKITVLKRNQRIVKTYGACTIFLTNVNYFFDIKSEKA